MIAPTLIVLLGPTGVEKTELSLQIAEQFAAPVVSCDSRQFYKENPSFRICNSEAEK